MTCLRGMMLLTAAALLVPGEVLAERTVVLVTDDDCPVSDLSSLDVRKAYLGVAVTIDGHRIRPVRLVNDDVLNNIFYQNVVHMSRKSYERRALSLTLKYGTPRAPRFESVAEAARAVSEFECGIVYLWKYDADRLDGLKTVRTLWQGE